MYAINVQVRPLDFCSPPGVCEQRFGPVLRPLFTASICDQCLDAVLILLLTTGECDQCLDTVLNFCPPQDQRLDPVPDLCLPLVYATSF